MVLLTTVQSTDLTDYMEKMIDFRQERKFCDAHIVAGSYDIYAHKCIIAAGSEYFNCLFGGGFMEAKASNIDLSKVTLDAKSLELVIDFLYTGQIPVNEENLFEIAKLTSYLVINKLTRLVSNHMNEMLQVHNCVKYYLTAVSSGFQILEEASLSVLKARFEEETLNLSSAEILDFIEKGVLEFCPVPLILKFLADWFLKERVEETTENRVLIGNKILDYCKQSSQNVLTGTGLKPMLLDDLNHKLETIKAKFGSSVFMVTEFKGRFERTSASLSLNKQIDKTDGKVTDVDERIFPEGVERVVISVSPRQNLKAEAEKEFVNRYKEGATENRSNGVDGPIHDIFVYVPRTRSWFYLQTVHDEGMSEELIGASYWSYWFAKDRLNCACPYSLFYYNLQTCQWKHVDFDANTHLLDIHEMYSTEPFGTEYIFSVEGVPYRFECVHVYYDGTMPENVFGASFFCYKMKQTGEWQFVLRTPVIALDQDSVFPYCCIVPDTNELLISVVRFREKLMTLSSIYSVDLNASEPVTVQVLSLDDDPSDEKEISSKHSLMHILARKDRFFMVTLDTEKEAEVTLKCKYQCNLYQSRVLLACNSTEITVHDFAIDVQCKQHPCVYRADTVDIYTPSLWLFGGNKAGANTLIEVAVGDDDGNLSVRHHTPPPFECTTALFAGNISSKILKNARPIQKNLLSDI